MTTEITRIEQIRKSLEAIKKVDNHSTYSVRPWRNGELVLPIISLVAQFLRYRIENSRTTIQQLNYLRNHPQLTKDFFSDPESSQTQSAQEEILLSMVLNKKDFINDLRVRKQVEPAIITYDGYIVNGNRRTAALKHLGEQYIKCVVLPEDAITQEIYELEQELQIAKEFKEPYHWINELKNIRRGVTEFNLKTEQQAKRLRLTKNQVEAKLRMLDLIDSFLIWKDIPEQYDYEKLDDAEQIFIELEKALRNQNFKRDIVRLEALNKRVFALIEKRPSEGRLYNYVTGLIRSFDKICNVMNTNQSNKKSDDTVSNTQVNNKNESDKGLFDELANDDEASPDIGISIEGFENSEQAISNTQELIDTIEYVKESEKEKDSLEALFNSVSKALRELEGVTVNENSTKLDATKKKLNQIKGKSDELIELIDKIINPEKA